MIPRDRILYELVAVSVRWKVTSLSRTVCSLRNFEFMIIIRNVRNNLCICVHGAGAGVSTVLEIPG